MITLQLTQAEAMIAWRLLRFIRTTNGTPPPSRPCIPPPRPPPAHYSGVVIPANIPMRDPGSLQSPRRAPSPKSTADTGKPEAP